MKFCSNCGSSTLQFIIPTGDHLPRYVCDNCTTIHYHNPNMVVGAICLYEHKVLLAKRDIEPRKGFWNLPCGFLENGETVEEGAVREVHEETGASIALGPLHTVYNLPHARQVYLIFKAEMSSDYMHETTESAEVKLFDIAEIPWEEMAFTSNVFALKNYIKDLENGFCNTHIGTLNRKA